MLDKTFFEKTQFNLRSWALMGKRKRKYVDEKTTTKLINKHTSIATVRKHLRAFASLPTSLIFPYPLPLKVLTNDKRGCLKVVAFDISPFKLFTLKFKTNQCRPHPVRGLKLLCEPCFYYLSAQCRATTRFSHYKLNNKQRYCTSFPIFETTVRIGSPS